MKFRIPSFCLAVFCLGLAACGGPQMADSNYKSKNKKGQELAAQTGDSALPADAGNFLHSGYAPLDSWMDERFKVRYENMPLDMVFDQKPVSDIRYQKVNLPTNAPLFYLVNANISRREILKQVADFYKLNMNIEMVEGKPSYVVVSGGGAGGGPAAMNAPQGLTGNPNVPQYPAVSPYPNASNVMPHPTTPTSGHSIAPAPSAPLPSTPAPAPYVPSFGSAVPRTSSGEL